METQLKELFKSIKGIKEIIFKETTDYNRHLTVNFSDIKSKRDYHYIEEILISDWTYTEDDILKVYLREPQFYMVEIILDAFKIPFKKDQSLSDDEFYQRKQEQAEWDLIRLEAMQDEN